MIEKTLYLWEMAKANKSSTSNSFARFCDYKSLKGVWSWLNCVLLFLCLEISRFDHVWTTIVLSSKGIGIWSPSLLKCIMLFFSSLISTLYCISSIAPRMLLCNISTSTKMVTRWPIKSQTIVSIFEDHKCNISNIFLYIYSHLWP